MQLVNELNEMLEREESPFRAQLLREDIARLEKLSAQAQQCPDLAEFQKSGTYIGWTQNDMMTHLVAEPLKGLLQTIHQHHHAGPSTESETRIRQAWIQFCKERNEKLVKCL